MNQHYNETFKLKLVNLYSTGTPATTLCSRHAIPRSTLYSWIKKYKKIKARETTFISAKELHLIKKELKSVKNENSILHECNCTKKSSLDKKLCAIKKLDGKYTVYSLCKALNVQKSTYYHRKLRSPEKTIIQKEDEILRIEIRTIFDEAKGRLGTMKIYNLLIEKGIKTSPKRVSRLMQEMNLVSVYNKKSIRYNYVPSLKYTNNLINRSFMQTAPNKVWVSDITYIYVNYKPYFLCVIIDLYSRMIIAYTISNNMKTSLVTQTLKKAYDSRNPELGLVFHSDQGSQYQSYEFRSELNSRRIIQSLSNPGCPYDNAVAEAFFRSLKAEEIYRWYYRTVDEMQASIAEYVDFYNKKRPHQTLNYKTPFQFEQEHYTK